MANEPVTSAGAPMRLCYRHPDTTATRGCSVCRRPICDACVGFGPHLEGVCSPCATSERRRSQATMFGALGVIAVLVGGAFVYLASLPPPVTYGEHKVAIDRAAERIANSPCDGASTQVLVDLLLKERDYRRVIDTVDAYDDACQPTPRLWWSSHGARMQIQDFAGAERDADRLIAQSPDDGDFWWWRAKARRGKGDLAGAEADLKKAIEVTGPKAFFSVVDLADLLEAQPGRACEAVPALAMLVQNQKDDARKRGLAVRLHRLVTDGHCPDPTAAMPDKGEVSVVCAAAPGALRVGDSTFDFSIQNTWTARTAPVATGTPATCRAEFAAVPQDGFLKGTAMRAWTGRLACEGMASVTAQTLHAVPVKAEEAIVKKLVDGALKAWCSGDTDP